MSFDYFNLKLFHKIPKSYAIGNYLRSYVAYSYDKEILSAASAGGIVTQMLIHGLETRRIDGVLAVSVGGSAGMMPQFYVARDREGVLRAAQSKYFPILKNCTLEEVLKKDERMAAIGLPCQIHGLRKGQELFRSLRERIAFCIGLFCGRCPSYQAAKFIIRRAGHDPNEVNEIRHRYGDQDHYYLKFNNGKETCIDDRYKMIGFGGLLFMDSFRCLVCPDRLNELSDVSVGDATRLEDPKAPSPNAVITRTRVGQEVMNELIEAKKIYAREVEIGAAIQYQRKGLINKKRGYAARSAILKMIPGQKVPKYSQNKPDHWNPVWSDYVGGMVQIVILSLTRNKYVYSLMHLIPYGWLKRLCLEVMNLSSATGKQKDLLR